MVNSIFRRFRYLFWILQWKLESTSARILSKFQSFWLLKCLTVKIYWTSFDLELITHERAKCGNKTPLCTKSATRGVLFRQMTMKVNFSGQLSGHSYRMMTVGAKSYIFWRSEISLWLAKSSRKLSIFSQLFTQKASRAGCSWVTEGVNRGLTLLF